MTYRIRDAGRDDRPVVVQFMIAMQNYENALHPSRPPGEGLMDRHCAYLEAEVARNDGRILLAETADGVPVGMLICMVEDLPGHYLTPDYQRVGHISDIWIEEDHRGGAVLDQLIDHTERHFAALGVERMTLNFITGNDRAQRAYAKRGFAPYEGIMERKIRQPDW